MLEYLVLKNKMDQSNLLTWHCDSSLNGNSQKNIRQTYLDYYILLSPAFSDYFFNAAEMWKVEFEQGRQ